jgi:uncharacterized protein YeaC (DUF1315 family)
MTDYADLNDMAAQALAELRADGITPTDADIVRLNALAWGVQCPRIRMELAKGRPVQCGNRWLWPLSISARKWYQGAWEGCRSAREAMAYAMAHAHDERLYKATEREVGAWIDGTIATETQLEEAMNQVIAQELDPDMPPVPDSEGGGMTDGELSAALVATAGGDADTWERLCSRGYCIATLEILAAQQRADGKPLFDGAKSRAFLALGWYEKQIRERAPKDGG